MVKEKVSWTIEDDYLRWVSQNSEGNASRFINNLIAKEIHLQTNAFSEIVDIEIQMNILEKRRDTALKKLELLLEEGNKKEKEEAEALLKDQERVKLEKEKERSNFIVLFESAINKYDLFHELENCKERIDIATLLDKISNLTLINDKSSAFAGSFKFVSYLFDKYVKKTIV